MLKAWTGGVGLITARPAMKPQLKGAALQRVGGEGSLKGGTIIAKALIDLKYPAVLKTLYSPRKKAVRIIQPKTPQWGPMSICNLENFLRSFW